jgi:hypothetical protein
MQIGFLVPYRRRVSLMAVFVILLALVVGSAAALAALAPSPHPSRGIATPSSAPVADFR